MIVLLRTGLSEILRGRQSVNSYNHRESGPPRLRAGLAVESSATKFMNNVSSQPVSKASQQPEPTVNLSGEWIGHYRGHFDQVIKITQFGDRKSVV